MGGNRKSPLYDFKPSETKLRQSRVELLMQSVCFETANDKAPCNYVCFTLSSAYSVSI